jgi:AcrR family transcriptional regulator
MQRKETESDRDRRVQRTRQSLSAAFIGLLKERDWDQIRVQDICDRANVGRSTFYNHYVDKEGLLVGGLTDLGAEIKANYGKKAGAKDFWFARGMLEHILPSEDLFRSIQHNHSGAILKARFCQLAVELARDCLKAKGLKEPRLDAAAYFTGGAFVELLGWYMNARKRPDVDGFETMFHSMAQSVLHGF